ncbi:hypothetical protein F5Y10DRAFT_271897 [Nemania abortiva]|nr:hypothetical protein F5Y10DRAFT_271897 [Nemania abortiva]
MDQDLLPDIPQVNICTWWPLHNLNQHRARLGLPPSRNLISSAASGVMNQQRQPTNSPAYQGDPSLPRNIPAAIPDELNCRLWITGLPPTCTVHQLLGNIRGIGPIFACHITQPNLTGPRIWETAAASLTFFAASAANEFLRQSSYPNQPFTVGGHRTRMVRHRIRTDSEPVNGQSRVLRIVGDPSIVRPDVLSRVFSELWNIRFDTDFVQFRLGFDGRGNNEVIWAFGSFRAQAHTVHRKINNDFRGRAQALYMADPCALEVTPY